MSEQKVIYSMVGVGKTHGGTKKVLRDIYLSYFYGAKIGVLGLNGSGKSTLLRIMAGVEKDIIGEAHLSEGYTVGLLEQEPQLDANKTVKEIAQEAVHEEVALLNEFEEITNKFATADDAEMERLITRQAQVQELLDAKDSWQLDDRLGFALQALGCPPADTPVKNLSGGERRRVALCRLLLQRPDVLLLDEPTNHLDAESVGWLERHLNDYPGTVIAVTHDRYFLDNVAGWILELDRGHGIPWKGNYSSWLEQKSKRLANEAKAESRRAKTLERELEWIRMAPKARQAKNKARISAYEKLLSADNEKVVDDIQLYIPPGPRLGEQVITFDRVAKSFGERNLYRDLSFSLPRGGIVGIIGPNGIGKTTLFRMIAGTEKPDSGTIRIGETAKIGYMEQSRLSLPDDVSVWHAVSGGHETMQVGNRTLNSRAYVAQFNFTGTDQGKKVGTLSGGERNRIQMALLFLQGANVLLLDEPTNDLDVNTLRSLEEALGDFPGCAVVISHDRWFLDRVATHILALDDDGQYLWTEGNYSAYEEELKQRGLSTDKGRGTRHARLTRH